MKIGITTGLVGFATVALLVAQTKQLSSPTPSKTPAATTAADAAKYRAWVNKYCVACHNNRSAVPAEDPVNLEKAGFDNLLSDAGTWERVLRKLSVRAMPPQGMPHPPEAEYAAFTGWLAASLDRAWEGRSNPGRYVVHRLNRAEYANAIRDLLAVDLDVSDLLPTDAQDVAATARGVRERGATRSRDGRGRSAGETRNHRAFDQPRIQPERIHRGPAARDCRRHGRSALFSG